MAITSTEIGKRIDANQSDIKKKRSHHFALGIVVEALGLTHSQDIGTALGSDLHKTVDTVKKYLSNSNRAAGRVANIISDIRAHLPHYLDFDSSRESFEDALSAFRSDIKSRKITATELVDLVYEDVKKHGIKRSYVKNTVHWSHTKEFHIPVSEKILKVLESIDSRANCKGVLFSSYKAFYDKACANARVGESTNQYEYIDELSEKQKRKLINCRVTAALRTSNAPSSYLRNYLRKLSDLPMDFQKAIPEINSFKTTGFVGGRSGNVQQKSRWKVKNQINADSAEATILNKFGREHKECRTGNNTWAIFGAFFAYQTLPEVVDTSYFQEKAKTPLSDEELAYILPNFKGKGRSRDSVSFFSLLDMVLVQEYYEHCVQSGMIRNFISFTKSINALFTSEKSYFTTSVWASKASSDYLVEQGYISSQADLDAYLEEYKESIGQMKLSAENDFKDKSESMDNIDFILARERPLSFSIEVYLNAKSKYMEDASLKSKLGHYRNLLVQHLEIYNPLRASSLAALTIPKKSGTLRPITKLELVSPEGRIKAGANYRIVFDKSNFKNIYSALQEDYEADFPVEVEDDLRRYLEVRELYLERHNATSDYLLIPTKNKDYYHPEKGMSPESISTAFKNFVIEFRPVGDYRFTPYRIHSNRHIVATNFLRENPENYVVVAEILHDNIETVLKRYANFSTAKGLESQRQLVQTMMESVNSRRAC